MTAGRRLEAVRLSAGQKKAKSWVAYACVSVAWARPPEIVGGEGRLHDAGDSASAGAPAAAGGADPGPKRRFGPLASTGIDPIVSPQLPVWITGLQLSCLRRGYSQARDRGSHRHVVGRPAGRKPTGHHPALSADASYESDCTKCQASPSAKVLLKRYLQITIYIGDGAML